MSDLSDFKINDIAIPPSHGHKILKDYELHRHQIHAIFKLGGFSLKKLARSDLKELLKKRRWGGEDKANITILSK